MSKDHQSVVCRSESLQEMVQEKRRLSNRRTTRRDAAGRSLHKRCIVLCESKTLSSINRDDDVSGQ